MSAPTPETDLATHRQMTTLMCAETWERAWREMAIHARKLERERDALRRESDEFKSKMSCGHLRRFGTAGVTCPMHCIACERDRLRNDLASGVHSCHDQCSRPVCVIRRERDALRNLLTIALQHGLTDQVRAEAREMLKLPNEH